MEHDRTSCNCLSFGEQERTVFIATEFLIVGSDDMKQEVCYVTLCTRRTVQNNSRIIKTARKESKVAATSPWQGMPLLHVM